jgi:hypothetical protein
VKFYRIDPLPQEILYVLAEDSADLNPIANNPVCFSPISYRIEDVESGDIPVHAKIVTIDPASRKIKRINLETAIKMESGEPIQGGNDVSAAIETLKAAFQRNGLNSPLSIQLESSDQAVKLAMMFGDRLSNNAFARLIASISTGQDSFLIGGVRFTWPVEPTVVRRTKLQRLKRAFGLVPGGDPGSATEEGAG